MGKGYVPIGWYAHFLVCPRVPDPPKSLFAAMEIEKVLHKVLIRRLISGEFLLNIKGACCFVLQSWSQK